MRVVIDCTGGDRLTLARASVREGIGSLFEATLSVLARDPIALTSLVGRDATLFIEPDPRLDLVGEGRSYHGFIRLADQTATGGDGGATIYELVMVPHAWVLAQRRGYRILQHATAGEMLRDVLDQAGLQAKFCFDAKKYPKLACRVQYGETDLDFVLRLAEEAGVTFAYLPDAEGAHQLFFQDDLGLGTAAASLHYVDNASALAPGKAWAGSVRQVASVCVDTLVLTGYDLHRAAANRVTRAGEQPRMYTHVHDSGAGVRDVGGQPRPVGDKLGAFRIDDDLLAERAERLAGEAKHSAFKIYLQSNCLDASSGRVICLHGHPLGELDAELLVTGTVLQLAEGRASIQIEAVRAGTPVRLPWRTQKPRVVGLQSATVASAGENQPWCDELGRVRVQFPWDVAGDQSSAWLRLAQAWSGRAAGAIAVPRVGQEVLVAFLEGDPDQPVVVGTVANALHMPPYPLPAASSRTTLRTESLGEGFNELSFEDAKGGEKIYLHAARDLRRDVRRNEDVLVGESARLVVRGQRHVVVDGAAHHRAVASPNTVDGDIATSAGGEISLTAGGGAQVRLNAPSALAAEALHIAVDDELVIDASDITLRVGSNFIRISESGIVILANQVDINSGGTPAECDVAEPSEPTAPERIETDQFDLAFWKR